uniref:DUF2961 domain-containing protein n=1 Tax=uncultured bacterium FLS12 TaxID=651659 RepID=C5HLA8_9BACT|nr:hypothetical protein Franean1_7052 [uncultured bacterium FLS12]
MKRLLHRWLVLFLHLRQISTPTWRRESGAGRQLCHSPCAAAILCPFGGGVSILRAHERNVMKTIRFTTLVLVAAAMLAGCAHTQPKDRLSDSFFSDMMYLKPGHQSARASSWNETGKNRDMKAINPGDTLVLADLEGAGCIRHIYFTIAGGPHYMRDLVLRMWWDGEEHPSVEAPFGDFFGLGHERVVLFKSLLVTVNEGGNGYSGTHGFNCYFPMPFARGAKLTLSNEGPRRIGAVWYHVDYELFDDLPDQVGRFHAQWRRENPTVIVPPQEPDRANLDGKDNYVILDAQGTGNLAGYFLHVENLNKGWYGEGDDMIFIDGEDWPPSFHGTGSEEIFGGGACPNTRYTGPYTGYHLVASPGFAGKQSMYRFFANDPIRFDESIRVTIEHGTGNNLANDYTSTAFWYQTEPHAPHPPLPPVPDRYARTGDDPYEVAYQRLNEFKRKMGEITVAARQGRVPFDIDTWAEAFIEQSVRLPKKLDEREYDDVITTCDAWIARLNGLIEKGNATEQ